MRDSLLRQRCRRRVHRLCGNIGRAVWGRAIIPELVSPKFATLQMMLPGFISLKLVIFGFDIMNLVALGFDVRLWRQGWGDESEARRNRGDLIERISVVVVAEATAALDVGDEATNESEENNGSNDGANDGANVIRAVWARGNHGRRGGC